MDQDVELAIESLGFRDHANAVVLRSGVAGNEGRIPAGCLDLINRLLPVGGGAHRDDDLRPLGREQLRGCLADACPRADDERNSAVQLSHDVLPQEPAI